MLLCQFLATDQARVNRSLSEADAIRITLRYGTRLMTIENATLVLRSVALSVRSLPPSHLYHRLSRQPTIWRPLALTPCLTSGPD